MRLVIPIVKGDEQLKATRGPLQALHRSLSAFWSEAEALSSNLAFSATLKWVPTSALGKAQLERHESLATGDNSCSRIYRVWTNG